MQYPAQRGVRFSSQVVRFVDGREQRYRDFRAGLRRWVVRLDLLEEGELAELEWFFRANQGAFSSFTFADPWDQHEYTDCSIEEDAFEAEWEDELRGRTTLTVRENRG
jgi:hypothetical protein